MTGRFFRREIPWEAYGAAVGLAPPPGIDPPPAEYNIAPGSFAPIIRHAPEGEYAPRGAVQIAPALWGLIPVWWKKPLSEKAFSSFNARAEEITVSKVFSGAFRQGRCLVPASGYYAWAGPKGASQPFAVAMRERSWFCFAGLWSRAMIDGSEIDTFAIVTTDPNDLMAGLSTRMPVILDAASYRTWLDPMDRNGLGLLRPYPVEPMKAWAVNPAVGNVRNQGPELLSGD
jgi:putative SOS response-associated peptidase YedK